MTTTLQVPYLDLGRARRRIAAPLEQRWQRILETSAFVLGPEVREFERRFADFLAVPACAGVANGTDALVLSLRALGVGAGDEVILPAFSFFATVEAVLLAGGVPVFCDIDAATFNLDPADAAARVTPRTKGIIGVHLYGRPFDVDAVLRLCDRHGLWLLEDAAQAHGALHGGRRVGGLGRLAAWSFYPTKNLGCFGDGGAVTGSDGELVERARRLANHGMTTRYHHVEIGVNSRLDSLQAAVLNCRLTLLEADNARRRELACRYYGGLAGAGDLALPPADPPGSLSVYHQLTVRTSRRDALMRHLAEHGVTTSIHYPSPLHRQPALAGTAAPPVPAGELPAATAAAAQVLCLPMFPELTNEEVEAVCEAVQGFFA
ncbi:MAG TPA: DegT/DnrJ/EryC1/StrS family aminotransferase [Thermoanaerobaculia bacterium]|jgi:dTDP-4-amino-4,6-dideoxygalactose transaminase|nr:DegT/DnrJ/EryC1/StrS family aminotransferase [Thermoanaerobaculia bacterium]